MKLLPRTLGGRTLLLVIATVLLAEAATFFVLDLFRQGYIARRGAENVIGYVHVIQSAVEAMPPSARAQFAASAMTADRIRVLPYAAINTSARAPFTAMRRDMATRIRAALGPDTEVDLLAGTRAAPQEMWVSFSGGGERWWLIVPAGRFDMPLPWALLAILATVVAAAMLFGAAFVRNIVRPLRELEHAAGALQAGQPRPVTPSGPHETHVLAERFNAMLEQLDKNERERAIMLAGLPHDLRAPLTRLRLRLAMLDDEARAGIERDAEDIDRIANQFIAYLRGISGAAQPHQRIDLRALAEERARHYTQLGKAVTVHGDNKVLVSADAEALHRLLDNLIDNALRYGAEPVEISVGTDDADDDRALLTVRDHGTGIASAEQMEQALQPFTRLEAARSGSGSCGLGLAIVDRIARAHGGAVTLKNAPDGGLSVAVTLGTETKS